MFTKIIAMQTGNGSKMETKNKTRNKNVFLPAESEFINEGGIFSGEEKTEDALEIFSSIKAFSIKFISLKLPKTESEFSSLLEIKSSQRSLKSAASAS